MRRDWRQWLDAGRPRGAIGAVAHYLGRTIEGWKIPAPGDEQLLRRITTMERDIMLPLKAAGVGMLLYSFYFRPWMRTVAGTLDIAVEQTQYFVWLYIAANVLVAGVLLAMRRLPLGLVQWVVFTVGLLDGLFLSALIVVTGGYQSFLYWLFLGLIVRSAVSVPRATSQLALNFTIIACYVLAGVINISVAESLEEEARAIATSQRSARPSSAHWPAGSNSTTRAGTETAGQPEIPAAPAPSPGGVHANPGATRVLDEVAREDLGVYGSLDNPAEHLSLRLVLLLLLTVCCYGVQLLLERQRQALEEAREFAMREGQLRSAGRLAAEFAHQIKNPLAIINNAAFSLQRALKEGKPVGAEHIRIIQEEVEHSDRIITQVMGYAQLSEGRVEKLSVTEELDRAIAQVFPPAAQYPVRIHRDYAGSFPPLLMQRCHVSETFVNLLQNGREALDGKGGNIWLSARCRGDYSIEVAIADDGPGIAADKQGRIFQPYYTTKEKGTGLGLASVKHNVELYGGSVRVESELGKGARFVLVFPARTQINFANQT